MLKRFLFALFLWNIPTTICQEGVSTASNEEKHINTKCDISDFAIEDEILIQYPSVEARVPKYCFSVGNQERCFYLLLPDCAKEQHNSIDGGVRLIVDFHDQGSCPLEQSQISGWLKYGLSECFVVAWPLGVTDPNIADEPCFTVPGGKEIVNRNAVLLGIAPDCCCQKEGRYIFASETNDVEFIHTLISVAIDKAYLADIQINSMSVHLTGHGNGATAAMGYTALHSEMVACLSPFSGTIVTPFAIDYTPVPIFTVLSGHTYEDQEVSLTAVIPPGNDDITTATTNTKYLLPSPSRVDGYFSDVNQCGNIKSGTNKVKGDEQAWVTAGKFEDCLEPVNFMKPPHNVYKTRSSYNSNSGNDSESIDTTGLIFLFCYEKYSATSAYIPTTVEVTTATTSSGSIPSLVIATFVSLSIPFFII